jgi:hypothetical protein
MTDDERRLWLVGQIAAHADAAKKDLDKVGHLHSANASILLDAGLRMDIFTVAESGAIEAALNDGVTDNFELINLLDR